MKRILLMLMALSLWVAVGAAVVFGAGAQEEAAREAAATAAVPGTDIVKVVDRYTVKESWLEAPTASQLGITTFSEAPMLAAMVQRGELPPVVERLPDDPLVFEPYGEIGTYGGELRVARTGPRDWGDLERGAMVFLFRADPTLNEIIPFGAKGYALSGDRRVLTLYLREGMKWSDGAPFTTADFMWMYDNIITDYDIRSSGRIYWSMGGELSKWEALDDYTLQVTFQAPITPTQLIPLLNWQRTREGRTVTPAHYAKEFHPEFNPNAEKMAKDEGYENWIAHLAARIDTNAGQKYTPPQLGAWVMERRDSAGKYLIRNPYFLAVDTAGNQLPYIDKLIATYFADKQVAILSMMQGQVDVGGRLMDPGSFALYKQNEEVGDYRILEWQDTKTARVIYSFSLNHQDPVKRPIFLDKRFRQAMSLAINREEINQFVFLGMATPQQFTVDPGAEFYDPAWARSYADYDPQRAMKLLDEMGMRDRDGDDWREAPGGEPFALQMLPHTSSVLGTMGDNVSELVRDYWQEIGIKVGYKQISQELREELSLANQLDLAISISSSYMPSRLPSRPEFGGGQIAHAREWGNWRDHKLWEEGGRQGEEPPVGREPTGEWREYLDAWHAWVDAPNAAEFNRIGREVWQMQADLLPVIGTVGKAVRPIIINNRIRNVPEVLPFSFESLLWVQTVPAQWFIKE